MTIKKYKMRKSILLMSSIFAFLTLSCGGDASAIHLQEENNAKVLQAEVEKAFTADKVVSELSLYTPPLDTRLQYIAIDYWEGAEEFNQVFDLKEGMQEKRETLASQNIKRLPAITHKSKDLVFNLKDVDYSNTYSNFIKAVTLVMEEYPEDSEETYDNFVLHRYAFKATAPNQIKEVLTLHAKKVGEKARQYKRKTNTSYYEFTFVVGDNGELEWI